MDSWDVTPSTSAWFSFSMKFFNCSCTLQISKCTLPLCCVAIVGWWKWQMTEAILRLIIRATRGRREIIKADNLGECHPGHAFFQHGKNYFNTEKNKILLRQTNKQKQCKPLKNSFTFWFSWEIHLSWMFFNWMLPDSRFLRVRAQGSLD